MNTEDFKPIIYPMEKIFDLQKEVKYLYEPHSKELFKHFDIDVYEDQEIFKTYCWRIVEELTEALDGKENENHFKEELIDGFNFLLELTFLCGKGYDDIKMIKYPRDVFDSTENQILNTIHTIGMTANLLKNRKWRRSQYLVDMYIFEKKFIQIWQSYMDIFNIWQIDIDELKALWSLKYQVNIFRIKTNY